MEHVSHLCSHFYLHNDISIASVDLVLIHLSSSPSLEQIPEQSSSEMRQGLSGLEKEPHCLLKCEIEIHGVCAYQKLSEGVREDRGESQSGEPHSGLGALLGAETAQYGMP